MVRCVNLHENKTMNHASLQAKISINEAVESGAVFIMELQKLVIEIVQKAATNWHRADQEGRRTALLQAYKLRHKWKKSDVPHLLALGVNATAVMRIERIKILTHRGRPIVRPYRPLAETIEALAPLFHEATQPTVRVQKLKTTPWWPYFVEALYRGEYEVAKKEHRNSASDYAERCVGDTLNISSALVRKLSGEVRRKRKFGAALPDTPGITVADFQVWKETGDFPATYTEEIDSQRNRNELTT